MASYLHKFLHKFQHLEIGLEEIKSATNNFNAGNCIGVGGYGKVYKGEVSHYRGRSMVAIKRLSSSGGQGTPEFLKEITTLSRYSHENLISLLGFCYEEKEMILVYEHASRGSLDCYLNSSHLTWPQRIKICLDAATGLSYLHDPGETHQRLIHCDIKSSNILLDDQWNAKVADLGLSVIGSANEHQSLIVTLAAGTLGYIDPEYMMTHTLTKESDVYSLGVVLFEVLCGTLCYTCSDGRTKILVPTWTESYKQRKLSAITFKSPTVQPLDQSTLEIFSDIAYRCLNESREDRPMMTEVVTKLMAALVSQEFSELKQLLSDYEEMPRSADPPIKKILSSKFLHNGVLLNYGRTWVSLNKKDEHCELISIAECLDENTHAFESSDNSRFDVGPCRLHPGEKCKVHVKTQFLSIGITYTMNLVLRKTELLHPQWVPVQYKLEGETETSNSYIAYESDGGYWWMCELYQFTSDQMDNEILFEFEVATDIEVEGIDFRPVEGLEHTVEVSDPDANWDEKLLTYYKDVLAAEVSDLDPNWEEKLPTNYNDLLENCGIPWTTKNEAYSILRKGFLDYDDKGWYSIDDNGNLGCMVTVRDCLDNSDGESNSGIYRPSPKSRFGEVYECSFRIPDIIDVENYSDYYSDRSSDDGQQQTPTLNALYLVYKLPKDFEMNHPVLVVDEENNHWYFYLSSPETPVIRPKAHQNTHSPFGRPKIKGHPRRRDDGWIEVQIWKGFKAIRGSIIHLKFPEPVTTGLIIEGIDFR